MSDLISRSVALENYCSALCLKTKKGEYCKNCIVKSWLNNQPTAFDVDKVVEQLEEFRAELAQFGADGILTDMLEVVRAGGKE